MKLRVLPSTKLGTFGRVTTGSGHYKLSRYAERALTRLKGWRSAPAYKLAAVALPVALLLVGVTSFSPTHADPMPVCDESGAISSDATWTADCVYVVSNVTVLNGVTLTIDPGAIVKESGSSDTGIRVNSGGTLDATGTSGSHITFTSYMDDTFGGDSNGDGSASSPAVGDYASAIALNGGTADVTFADFKYASTAIGDHDMYGNLLSDGSTLSVTDSSFADSYNGIAQSNDNSLSLERNSFALGTASSGSAIAAVDTGYDSDVTGVVLSGSNENTFSGSGPNVLVETGGSVPSGDTWAVDAASGATVWNNYGLAVSGTLTLGSGTVFQNGAACSVNGTFNIDSGATVATAGVSTIGIKVNSGGTLDATGASGDHITFTSGDSGTHAAGDYKSAIAMNGGTADVSYADFEYASTAIGDVDSYGNPLASNSDLTVTDSSFTNSNNGVVQSSDDSLTLERNSFTLGTASAGGYAITANGASDLSSIVLSGSNTNTFTGSGSNLVVVVDGMVPSSATWAIDPSNGALVEDDATTTVNGTLTVDSNSTFINNGGIRVNGTVNLDSGVVVKSSSATAYNGIQVNSGGTLNTSGTSTGHVVFTSSKDDTVGDTVPSISGSPAAGDYASAIAMNGGTAVVGYTDFKYAGTAIGRFDPYGNPLATGSDLTVTYSSFTDSNHGIDQANDNAITLGTNSFSLSTSGSSGNYPIAVSGDPDLSGVILSGSGENTFSGSGPNVVVSLSGSVPSGVIWTVDNTSGAVLFLDGASGTAAVAIDGTVNLDAGVVVKVGGQGFDVKSDGTFNATGGTSGSHSTPIVFTSLHDSTVGGASNADSSSTGSAGDYTTAVRFDQPGSSDVVSYVVFKYATKALSVGTIGTLNVDDSQFTNNDAAFDADTTTGGSNAILDSALASVCAWPYANQINISQSWFGSSGEPGDSVDLSGYVGLTMPSGYPGLSQLYGYVTTMYPLTGSISDNTIPWTVWSCGIPGGGPTVTFPVTDVNVGDFASPAIASGELWTASNLAE